ncbi:MAG: DUF371 domain-containing protein [archaeon]|nr:DUF371 domain-containing protein [archaeon]
MLKYTIKEEFFIFGHENVASTHPTTVEFTKDNHLGRNGDCILGVSATKSFSDFSDKFKKKIRSDKAKIVVEIEAYGVVDKICGLGHPELSLSDTEDMVIRKSDFVCGRTLCIHSDKAAADVDRRIVGFLKKQGARAKVTIYVSE